MAGGRVVRIEKVKALAKLLSVKVEDITTWSDGSLTVNNHEYDTRSGIGKYVGKVGRYAFYTSGRV
jgi:hypothetical protein